ncbi:MAG: MarR family winged helix-turn-helix transcriptional regulator [Solirubrobacterales bacterium]
MDIFEFKNMVWEYTRKIEEGANTALYNIGSSHGLTGMQTIILMELHRKGSSSIGNLADNVCTAGTNISTMCKKLEKQGFIERKRDIEDERIVRINLTDKGHQAISEIDIYLTERISNNLPEECFDKIITSLETLYLLLKKI